ncbi:MAG: helix-turn-helix domain-containing protein [Serratia sp. (in: enterobacteria)]|uniref:helix-turn-helix domain-containing protein n=1 Tax=Serratia sp. (in: enterobacteria) TaxID=616 RepID=UPI003F354770
MNRRISVDRPHFGIPESGHKPINHINKLVTEFLPHTHTMLKEKGATIQYTVDGVKQCFVLLEGSVALHRRGDGMMLNSESTPFVFGISNQYSTESHMYIRALEESKIGCLGLEEANAIVAEKNLWESLTQLVIYTTGRIYDHCALISQMSAYDIIRFQLVELMQESEAFRLNTTATNYIKSRSYLSRSGIMRILSELRTGGYIAMSKGILLEINHLPLKY